MHPEFPFEMQDQRVNRRHIERIAADEERVKAQRHAQAFIRDVPRDHFVERAIRPHHRHLRHGFQHIRELRKGLRGKLLIAHAIDGGAFLQDLRIAIRLARREGRDALAHRRLVAAPIEMRAIREGDAIERIERLQRDMVRQPLAAERPKLLQQIRRGDERGAAIEGETILLQHGGATPGGVEPVHHCHAIAPRAQADRGGQATDARADHDRMRSQRIGHRRSFARIGRKG